MNDLSERNFGLAIAYLIPGFVVLGVLGRYSGTIRGWLAVAPESGPAVGGFLYATLASMGLGLCVSAARWLTLDQLHHRTGIRPPQWDFSALQANLEAFDSTIQNHYRHYQFYGNTLVALLGASLTYRPWPELVAARPWTASLGFLALLTLLFVASRDTLQKHYLRSFAILRSLSRRKEPSDG